MKTEVGETDRPITARQPLHGHGVGPGRRGAAPRALRPESAARGRLKSTWSWISLPGGPFTNAKKNCTARHSFVTAHVSIIHGGASEHAPLHHTQPPTRASSAALGTARHGAARHGTVYRQDTTNPPRVLRLLRAMAGCRSRTAATRSRERAWLRLGLGSGLGLELGLELGLGLGLGSGLGSVVILVEPTALRDEEVDELGGVECDARGGATYQGDLAARPKPLACLGSGLGWGWDFFGLGLGWG